MNRLNFLFKQIIDYNNYMDDFVLWADSKIEFKHMLEKISYGKPESVFFCNIVCMWAIRAQK